MTSQEMSKEFNIVFESVASMNAPGYTEYEKSVLLTQAQQDIAIETAKMGLDSNDYSREVLEKLITRYGTVAPTEDSIVIQSTSTNRVYRVALPTSPVFLYPYIEFAITGTGATYYERVCKPIDYDSYYTTISNPYSNPYKDLYWRLYDNGYFLIITDGTQLTTPYMKGLYICKPDPIITASISPLTIDGLSAITDMSTARVLTPIVHREIVKRAAMKAYAAMKDQAGYQLQNAEQQDN